MYRLATRGWLQPCHYYPDRRQEAATHYLIVIIRVEGNKVSPTLHTGVIYLENRHIVVLSVSEALQSSVLLPQLLEMTLQKYTSEWSPASPAQPSPAQPSPALQAAGPRVVPLASLPPI